MTFPIIHLNGTSAHELIDRYFAAARAVSTAMETVQAAYPNARDYYPGGNALFAAAEGEHRTRMLALKDVYGQLWDIVEHITEQKDVRRARR